MGRCGEMISKTFRGTYDHTIDEKGRLSFPSRFREILRQYDSEALIVIPWWDNHLRVYPLSEWEAIEKKLMADDREQPEDLEDIIRQLLSDSIDCSLDRQGRILLPPNMRAELDLKKDIVLLGVMNRVEIWDKDTWTERRKVGREDTDKLKKVFRERRIF